MSIQQNTFSGHELSRTAGNALLRRESYSATAKLDLSWFHVGEHRIACPYCVKRPRDKTLGITVRSIGDAVAHCFRCGFKQSQRDRHQTRTHHKAFIKPTNASRAKFTSLSPWGRSVWGECLPISGIARDYLDRRLCVIPPRDGDLRWHPELKHTSSGYVGAALVGLVTHIDTGEPLSLHRTWITSEGKADVTPNRMLLGQHVSKNGVIRLYPDDCVTTSLGIAEGIETALSLAHECAPVWAAVSAGNMGSLPALDGIECLTIAVDTDVAGCEAADELSKTWHTAGVRVRQARVTHGDLNDHLEVRHG